MYKDPVIILILGSYYLRHNINSGIILPIIYIIPPWSWSPWMQHNRFIILLVFFLQYKFIFLLLFGFANAINDY